MQASFFWLIIIIIIWINNFDKQYRSLLVVEPVETTIIKKIKTFSTILTDTAQKNLGKPYVYGKSGPESFDCSGFVYGMYKQLGINIPRISLNQSEIKGNKISRDSLEKGDLVFFDTSEAGMVNHSGIYLGDGKFIHSSSGKANAVTISSLDDWYKDKFKWGKRFNANK